MRELEYHKLKTGSRKNIKLKQLKRLKKEKISYDSVSSKEFKLTFGSVWGIQDRLILFDKKRKEEHFKESLRPNIVLETPQQFDDFSAVSIAPGTRNFTYSDSFNDIILTALVPPEDLRKTTYFKIYFQQYILQKNLEKKFCEISGKLKTKLEKILNG